MERITYVHNRNKLLSECRHVHGHARPGRHQSGHLAAKCDAAFPERRGWFSEFYAESRHWPEVPASFKSWPEYEHKAANLRDWSPSIVTGLLQTADYAHALISVQPHIGPETVSARLANRMQRQQRVMGRGNPPSAWFIIDELSLYRQVGSAEAMAAQLRHLLEVAAMPKVTIQVLSAVVHPVNASGDREQQKPRAAVSHVTAPRHGPEHYGRYLSGMSGVGSA